MPCAPSLYPGSIRHGDENGSPLRYHRSPCHVGQSVVKDQVAHVVGRATWRQLVKHFMGEGGVACQLSQNAVDLSHDSGRPQRAESSMLRPLDGSGPIRHGASISLRHRPIRHCDVLIVMRGRGVVDGRLQGRPSRARSRIHLDVWTTDDTSRFDSEEAINPATCSDRPISTGARTFI